ncbi:uncharacterized protein [Nicotiana tomentosiformis]|uniref:uncharacterized protein n=1 Tax=Nicotiana tomentosiformis TaxID=4098 RepID=UPI00388C9C67
MGSPPQAPRVPQGPQAMVSSLVATPPVQPARGGGLVGKGHPREREDTPVLFDLGSTYLYVPSYFSPYLVISRNSLSALVYVSTPVGDSIEVDHVYHSCLVTIRGYETRVDLLLFSIVDFDVILGMYLLLPYHTILDCHAKTVTLSMPGLSRLEWRGTLNYIPCRVVSFPKAQRMMEKGCFAYLAFVRDVSDDTPTVESVPAVRDFPDVFLADLTGMPPDKDIDFGIDLVSDTQPILIPPYLMAAVELKEL